MSKTSATSAVEDDRIKAKKGSEKLDRYRVFISYSHEDLALVTRIVEVPESIGLETLWDQNFLFGHGFHEQIRPVSG